jgi:large subunit ribosomal protein L29
LKTKEIRALSTADLSKQLEEAHQELLDLRFRLATRQLVNHREIPRAKKKIARLNTIIKERESEIRQVPSGKKA